MNLVIKDLNIIPESCNGFMVVDDDHECTVYTCDIRAEAERFVARAESVRRQASGGKQKAKDETAEGGGE